MYWWYSKIAIHQFYVNINERTIQLWRADIADSLKEISFSSRTEHSAIYDYSVNTLEERAGHGAAAPGPPGLLPVQVVCTRGLGEALPGHEVHHGGLAGGEAERGERHVAVEEPALVDQPEDLRFRHLQQHTSERGQAGTFAQHSEGKYVSGAETSWQIGKLCKFILELELHSLFFAQIMIIPFNC